MPIISTVTAFVSAGTTAESRIVPLNLYNEPFDVSFGLHVEASAGDTSVQCGVQHTFDNIYKEGVSAFWFDHSTVSGIDVTEAPIDGSYTEPVVALRAHIATGTAGAPVTKAILKVVQGGY